MALRGGYFPSRYSAAYEPICSAPARDRKVGARAVDPEADFPPQPPIGLPVVVSLRVPDDRYHDAIPGHGVVLGWKVQRPPARRKRGWCVLPWLPGRLNPLTLRLGSLLRHHVSALLTEGTTEKCPFLILRVDLLALGAFHPQVEDGVLFFGLGVVDSHLPSPIGSGPPETDATPESFAAHPLGLPPVSGGFPARKAPGNEPRFAGESSRVTAPAAQVPAGRFRVLPELSTPCLQYRRTLSRV